MTRAWTKREFIGERQLDKLKHGNRIVLKAFRKWWPDGSSCLDIIKYVKDDEGREKPFYPIQHIQITWELSKPYLVLFDNKAKRDKIKEGIANSLNPSGRPRISYIKTDKLVELHEGGCKEHSTGPMSFRALSRHLHDFHKKKIGHVTVGNRIKEFYKNRGVKQIAE